MEIGISRRLAITLVILTVLISAASTWILIDSTLDSPEQAPGLGRTLVRLHILKAPAVETVSDTNSGQVHLNIASDGG